MGIPRRALGDDERVVLAVRPHGRVLVGPVVVLFVLALVLPFPHASERARPDDPTAGDGDAGSRR